MKLDKVKREIIQNTFCEIYFNHTNLSFPITGKKTLITNLFVKFSYVLGIEDFDLAFKSFVEYLEQTTERFVHWQHASPTNYIGFCANQNSIEAFKIKKANAANKSIAGQETEEAWSF